MTRIGLSYDPVRASRGTNVRRYDLSVLAVCLAGLATPAAAQTFTPPDSCEPYLTIQMKGCYVSNYWRCPDAPDGTVFEARHDGEGRHSASIYDAEFQWLDTRWNDDWRDRLVQPSADPISTTHLMQHGWDAYDFELWSDGTEPGDGVNYRRVRGMDILTGETVTIDGEVLRRTIYQNTYSGPDGIVTSVGRGRQFFSETYRLFFWGEEEWIEDGETERYDNSPVSFIKPGEPGFGSIEPAHDCAPRAVAPADGATKKSGSSKG